MRIRQPEEPTAPSNKSGERAGFRRSFSRKKTPSLLCFAARFLCFGFGQMMVAFSERIGQRKEFYVWLPCAAMPQTKVRDRPSRFLTFRQNRELEWSLCPRTRQRGTACAHGNGARAWGVGIACDCRGCNGGRSRSPHRAARGGGTGNAAREMCGCNGESRNGSRHGVGSPHRQCSAGNARV